MTCKDCICSERCEDLSVPVWDSKICDYECKFFKPKSRFVELPCAFGDTVYCIYQYNDCFETIDTPEIYESTVNGFVLEKGEVKVIPSDYSEKSEFWYKLIGVFLTRIEAEKVLKELIICPTDI